jgi:ribosomal protein S27AE
MDVWDGDNDRIASLGVDSMKCPKCGSESFWPIGGGRYYCQSCGHESKLKDGEKHEK